MMSTLLRALANVSRSPERLCVRSEKRFEFFASERKVSRGTAQVLEASAKFLEGTPDFFERTQCFLGGCQTFVRKRKSIEI